MKFEEWLSQQDGIIEVDCGCVTAEAFYHWMRVAYESGNSLAQSDCYPVQNQGWIPVSESMPDEGDHVLVSDGVGMEVSWIREGEWKKLRHIYSEDVTHWMRLPAAPQEVRYG